MRACGLVFLVGGAAASLANDTAFMPDCSTEKCPSTCSCVEKDCGASVYADCTADSQCNTLMTCLLKCSCGNVLCALGCVAGKTLDSVSESVKSCGSSCASSSEWEEYKATYKKKYPSADEETVRYKLFLDSKTRVAELNKLNGEPAFGINWMSDRHEWEKHKKGFKRPREFKPTAPVADFMATMRSPKSIDWRYTTAVTPVKNQGQCGSCWAFSATETIESQMILKSGGKYDFTLSPQQIASCAPNTGTYGCLGCDGGFTEGAYEYVKGAVGLSNGDDIPYGQSLTESENTLACPTSKVAQIDGANEELSGSFAQVSGYTYAVTPCTSGACTNQNLKAFAAALEKTPVSVCVNAGVWNDYTGGVLTSAACGSMAADEQDHCVQAVGFNSTA